MTHILGNGLGLLCILYLVDQSCPTLCNPTDCSPPSSSVQARILEWVAIPFPRGSSWCRDQTRVFCLVGRFSTVGATRESQGLVQRPTSTRFWVLTDCSQEPHARYHINCDYVVGVTVRPRHGVKGISRISDYLPMSPFQHHTGGIFSLTKASVHPHSGSNLGSRCLSLLRHWLGRGCLCHIIPCLVRNHQLSFIMSR